MKITPNERLRKATEDILEWAKDLSRGQLLLYSDITEISGIGRDDGQWGALAVKLKRRMRNERGIVLAAEPNVGYRLLTADEQLRDNARRRGMRGQRQFWHGAKETAAIPDAELNVKQREVKIMNSGVLKRARREGLRAAKFVSVATKYNARPIGKKPKPIKAD